MHNFSSKKQYSRFHFWLIAIVVFVLLVLVFSYPLRVYSSDFQKNIFLEEKTNIELSKSIVLNFSAPVITSSIENNFSIHPSQEVSFKWEDKNRKLLIFPKGDWKPETTYKIDIGNGKNIIFQKIQKSFEFTTEKYPKLTSVFPKDTEKNVSVSMESPVIANFDRSLEKFNIKFMVNPKEELAYQMNEDKTQIRLLAKDDFKWQTNYKIEIFIKGGRQEVFEYKKIGQTGFETEAKPVPIEWDKNHEIRLIQAREFTESKIKTGKYIDVNLAQQVMVIFEDGNVIDSYLVSSGKKGMDSPEGSFKIENKANRAWSKKYNLWMPNWMAIVPSGEFGIHELPVWPGGFQEGASHLGTPVSHGCVRLGPGNAKRVFDWADLGTPVIIHK